MSLKLYILNGPNLNLLGQREPEIYGTSTLLDIEQECAQQTRALGWELVFRQTNHEGELLDWIQEARQEAVALILNAAAYTHTSIALHDALKTLAIPVLEVHLSNPAARETFRHQNYVSPCATGTIAGLGPTGYSLAINAAAELVRE